MFSRQLSYLKFPLKPNIETVETLKVNWRILAKDLNLRAKRKGSRTFRS
jgi:hypothetical protein